MNVKIKDSLILQKNGATMVQISEKDNTYRFTIKGKDLEVFFADDGAIELYELKNPSTTGFIFEDSKRFNVFINSLTDILSRRQEGEKFES